MSTTPHLDWHVVVPVKGGAGAKSRLRPPHGLSRRALASAIAHDCLVAVCDGVPPDRVHVVTSDRRSTELAERLGARVVADPAHGLDAAVMAGLAAARLAGAARPGAGAAVLLGDLPALRPADLRAGLAACEPYHRAVVPDASGTGTVLLAAVAPAAPVPSFGEGSAARHELAGHRRLELALPRLRTDVDDGPSLWAAVSLGVGRATGTCLRSLAGTLPAMQASVHRFEEDTGAGSVLLDDGRELRFDADVFARSSLRHLRSGQRVSVEVSTDGGAVTRLWIVGIGEGERIG